MGYPEFRSIVALRTYNIPKGDGHSAYSFTSSNELIGKYPGVVGIKTGFTDAAGHTLLFAAVRGGRTLIGDVLGSPASGPRPGAQDAAKLLNLGLLAKTVPLAPSAHAPTSPSDRTDPSPHPRRPARADPGSRVRATRTLPRSQQTRRAPHRRRRVARQLLDR